MDRKRMASGGRIIDTWFFKQIVESPGVFLTMCSRAGEPQKRIGGEFQDGGQRRPHQQAGQGQLHAEPQVAACQSIVYNVINTTFSLPPILSEYVCT
jgi:hypothetical protein